MTTDRALHRASHIKDSIADIRSLLRGLTLEQVSGDKNTRLLFERHLEIVSDASRGIPAEWRETFGTNVPWKDVTNLGNILRHAYDGIDPKVLWRIYTDHLDPLEAAIDAMIAAYGPNPPPPPRSS
ncbi:MAG: HepT-like ribonuclease domain-containing protein [Devosia sp.]